jgi:plastocyanin
MPSRVLGAIGLVALVVAPLAACGGGDDDDGPSTPADVTVHALDSLKFDSSSFTVSPATAGKVTIEYVNDGSITHSLKVDGVDSFRLQVSGKGDTDDGTVDLDPGTYTIYCDIPGHRQGGMEAELTVS